jgi:hypothetical protein
MCSFTKFRINHVLPGRLFAPSSLMVSAAPYRTPRRRCAPLCAIPTKAWYQGFRVNVYRSRPWRMWCDERPVMNLNNIKFENF